MKIAIIGGGASGLMAAVTITETSKAEVTVIERNTAPGRKILLTGGGRCNLTTGLTDIHEILSRYPRGGRFLSSAMRRFPPAAVCDWFEVHRMPLKTEDDNRVFPRSNNGHDVVSVFKHLLIPPQARLMTNTSVSSVTKQSDGQFVINLSKRVHPLLVDRLIIATGGQAYRQTGSTGDGYTFAAALGHTITELAPSLSGLVVSERWPVKLSGLSFTSAKLTAKHNHRFSLTGPLILTHNGLSGPAIFALSSLIAHQHFSPTEPLDLTIDLFPEQNREELLNQLTATTANGPRRNFRNVLSELVPKRLADIICRELKTDPDRNAAEAGRCEFRRVVDWLKAIPLHLVGRRAGEEFVTAGGVSLSEVNPSTMESKICPGLFLVGEVLDIDGFTGGFNLQAAWCTGRLAGEHATKKLTND
ncbi:hypothetical protein A2480_04220 [Candidatus Uhrbacteria bacterium RIFOXYC2_FULL_47_19]|uniref:Flavoprotein n=1 Tax=Candidatus Uhrbacteria bacterium RIFOXYC2_FULL_47_19 TaxID=1802424 RepID=A0A1F7WDG6_9BACT|nr:MAG: hypothetical protein A2480_04220 [Candidatus Uhrbacteria bacterium RIFOXYC2_FULL_47_19]